MRCDMCPLCPIAEDDVCGIADDPKYSLEHKDGMMGCRHPRNWVEKKDREYCEHLAEMADGMARMMEEERSAGRTGCEERIRIQGAGSNLGE